MWKCILTSQRNCLYLPCLLIRRLYMPPVQGGKARGDKEIIAQPVEIDPRARIDVSLTYEGDD